MLNLTWTHTPRTQSTLPVALDRPTNNPQNPTAPPQIFYELHGTGQEPNKCLLIAGFGNSCRHWSTSLNYFKADGRFEVCVFDNRGVGDSTQDGEDVTVLDMAHDALDLLRHLGWRRNVFLLGFSMGGKIAMELTLAAPPNTFAAVAFMSTLAGSRWPTLASTWTYFKIATGLIPLKTQVDNYRFYCELGFPEAWLEAPDIEFGGKYKTHRDRIYAMLTERSKNKTRQTAQGRKLQTTAVSTHVIPDDRLKIIGSLCVPLRVYTGSHDTTVPASHSEHLAKVLGAPLEVLEGGGHMLSDMFPEEFHASLIRFFESAPAFVDSKTTAATMGSS
ncbi:hypothetical protein HDV05_005510 [Chytridiales sp. JEL 0842]|nr:hypothetical protein HDV05_005510 [Chytridiales sp. JEL 0842]